MTRLVFDFDGAKPCPIRYDPPRTNEEIGSSPHLPKESLMSRVLIAWCWMLIPLGLCSCVDDADVRPSPDPIITPTESATNVDPLPVKQVVAEQLTDNKEQKPIMELDPVPSSGNPLVDFFRSVDRGVKSTTAISDKPQPVETEPIDPDGGGKPAND
jgi:hypothetical protein